MTGSRAMAMTALLCCAGIASGAPSGATNQVVDAGVSDAPNALALTGSTGAHDPTIVECEGRYYRFSTGSGVQLAASTDLKYWFNLPKVFFSNPAWTRSDVPGSTDFWAPDVVKLGGRYRMYYSVSTFGSNLSAIGLASNATLDPNSPDYAWVDEGPVMESRRLDYYNCIDPAVAFDENGDPWMAFGSFWGGIKLVRLDRDTGKLAAPDASAPVRPASEPLTIARRSTTTAIEGAYILPKDGKYYLFVSFDLCCKGVASTYNIRVGRSDSISGPYLDRDGVSMLRGGGTLIREGGERYKGPGHNSILAVGDTYYLVYHAYDAKVGGVATLRVEPLSWDAEGWPYVVGTGAGTR